MKYYWLLLVAMCGLLLGNTPQQTDDFLCDVEDVDEYLDLEYMRQRFGVEFGWEGDYSYEMLLPMLDCAESNTEAPNLLNRIYTERGFVYLQMGQFDNALTSLDKAIEFEPSDGFPYQIRAQVHKELADFDQAITDLETGIELMLQNPNIPANVVWIRYVELGFIHFEEGNSVDEANTAFAQALELRPEFEPTLYRDKAYFFRSRDELDLALAEVERGLELYPEDRGLIGERGFIYYFMEHYEEAIDDIVFAIENTEMENADRHNILGLAYLKRSDPNAIEAERNFREAIRIDPNNPDYYSSLGDALMFQEREEEAIEAYQQALALGDEPFVYADIGIAYYFLGDFVNSRAFLQSYEALKTEPHEADFIVVDILAEINAALD